MQTFFVVAIAGANIFRFLLFVLDLRFGFLVVTLVKIALAQSMFNFFPLVVFCTGVPHNERGELGRGDSR